MRLLLLGPFICSYLCSRREILKRECCRTLFSLSVIIGQSGARPPLVVLFGNGTPRGKKDAATGLFNLFIFHENKAHMVRAGAIKSLVELMDPAAGMVDKAVAGLANLATIPEGQAAIGGGGIPALVRREEIAIAVFLQLCTNSNGLHAMVLQYGVIPPLVALSQSGTPQVKEKVILKLQLILLVTSLLKLWCYIRIGYVVLWFSFAVGPSTSASF